jgi:steroid delta-isomerase
MLYMVVKETIQSVVTGYFAANNRLDADAVAALFAPTAHMERVPGTPSIEGREAIRQAYRQLFGALLQSDVTAINTFIFGNGAAVLYRGEFTAKSGKSAAMEGIDVFEINEAGQIQAIRFYWDPGPFYAILQS